MIGSSRPGLLLLGHGSHFNADSSAAIHSHADRIRSSGAFAEVRVGFWVEAGVGGGGDAAVATVPPGQNAGSVFTNPEDDSAGRLVDAAGCRGLRHGTAEVSERHANFIQADEDGSADDVAADDDRRADDVDQLEGLVEHHCSPRGGRWRGQS